MGYVGLPLAVAFAAEGHDVVAVDIDRRKVDALRGGPLVHRGRRRRGARRRRAAHRGHDALRRPRRLRRDPHLRPDAADGQPRARPRPARRRVARARRGAARRAARRARVDDLSGHDARAAGADPRRVGPRRRRGLQPRLLARARRPRPHGLHDAHDAEGRRRADRGLPRTRGRAVRRGLRHDRARLHAGGRGADEAAGEHLPLGEHRARQRAGDALRPDGDRHLGGRRRGLDEALRLHALRAGPGDGRPLPAGRPVLPVLAGARVRHGDGVHRARRQGQPADALPLRLEGRAAAQRGEQARARLEDRGARRLLQGRRRRRARVAGAEDRDAAGRARRRPALPRPVRRRPARARAAAAGRWTRWSPTPTSRSSSPRTRASTTTRSSRRCRSRWTCAA